MPELHGPIQHVTIAATLWIVLAAPLLGALASAWLAARPAQGARLAPRASAAALATALVASLAHGAALAARPEGERAFAMHLWRMVRVGQLDASFDLALDPLSAAFAVAASGAGLACVVVASRRGATAARLAWLDATAFASLLFVLADGLVLLAFAWTALAGCAWGLTRDARGFVLARAADVVVALGIALLYWGLGGAWAEDGYVPDLNARFLAVDARDDADATPAPAPAPARDRDEEDEDDVPALPSTSGDGLLTLTSYSGALVYMDDARTPLSRAPGEPLRAPFARFHVRGGVHSFRIHPGAGLDDYLVSHVAFGEGREVALGVFGPAVSFRALRDELAARDATGRAPFADALRERRAWGDVGVVPLAIFLLTLGALARAPRAIAVPAWAYVAARLAFLAPLASHLALGLAIVLGAALAALLAWLARRASRRIGAALRGVAEFVAELDARLVAGPIHALAALVRVTAWIAAQADETLVAGAYRAAGRAVLGAGDRARATQDRSATRYVVAIALGLLGLALLQYWLR